MEAFNNPISVTRAACVRFKDNYGRNAKPSDFNSIASHAKISAKLVAAVEGVVNKEEWTQELSR